MEKKRVNKLTYLDLFKFIDTKCNFRELKKGLTWTCYHNLKFTKEFCKKNKLDFKNIEKKLHKHGGFCDCEVLLNVWGRINEKEVLK